MGYTFVSDIADMQAVPESQLMNARTWGAKDAKTLLTLPCPWPVHGLHPRPVCRANVCENDLTLTFHGRWVTLAQKQITVKKHVNLFC